MAAHRDAWRVALAGGDRDAELSGRFRFEAVGPGDLPAVGDWVAVSDSDPALVTAVLPRRTAFGRNRDSGQAAADQVLAANVDVTLVVTGLDGDFNLRRLERYIAVAWSGGATPVILLNKADTAPDPDGARLAAEAVAPGVDVRLISAIAGDGVAELARDHLAPGRTAVVLGSSGAGKSTLLNALLGEERARTGAVRADDARGRHTTTHRELHRLPGGGLLIDTPGIRSLGVAGADDGMASAFADVADLAADCRFADCRHESEPGCAVRSALADGRLSQERFASHRKLEREAAHVARQGDRLLAEAERRKWRLISSAGREHMARKYGSER
ncbi:MAG TPA: ribosome small subunit-dependent GTPase A [Candidatus Limnocylindrales bacterium]